MKKKSHSDTEEIELLQFDVQLQKKQKKDKSKRKRFIIGADSSLMNSEEFLPDHSREKAISSTILSKIPLVLSVIAVLFTVGAVVAASVYSNYFYKQVNSIQVTALSQHSCWDINKNSKCDLHLEDKNGDGECNSLDCSLELPRLFNGTDCWDKNANYLCDLALEDMNGDGVCNVTDCKAPLYRGVYSDTITYSYNDVVFYDTSTYVFISSKLISGINPKQNSTIWSLITLGFKYRGLYNSSLSYIQSEVVTYLDSAYICITNSVTGTFQSPANTTEWSLFAKGYNSNNTEITNLEVYSLQVYTEITTPELTVQNLLNGTDANLSGTLVVNNLTITSSTNSGITQTAKRSGSPVLTGSIITYGGIASAQDITSNGNIIATNNVTCDVIITNSVSSKTVTTTATLHATDTTDATSSTSTAALKVDGGVAIAKSGYFGTTVTAGTSFLIPSGVNITGNIITSTAGSGGDSTLYIRSEGSRSIYLQPTMGFPGSGSVIVEGEIQIGVSGVQLYDTGLAMDDGDLNIGTTSSGNVLIDSVNAVKITAEAGNITLVPTATNGYVVITTGSLIVQSGSISANEITSTSSTTTSTLNVTSTTDSTSYTTPAGSIQTSGGIYVAKSGAFGSTIRTGGVVIVQGVIQYGPTGITQQQSGLNISLLTTGVGSINLNPATGNGNVLSMFGGLFILSETFANLSVPLGKALTISDTTDATSSTSSASIKTSGGMAIAKSIYVGANVNADRGSFGTSVSVAGATRLSSLSVDQFVPGSNMSVTTVSGYVVMRPGPGYSTVIAGDGNLIVNNAATAATFNAAGANNLVLTGSTISSVNPLTITSLQGDIHISAANSSFRTYIDGSGTRIAAGVTIASAITINTGISHLTGSLSIVTSLGNITLTPTSNNGYVVVVTGGLIVQSGSITANGITSTSSTTTSTLTVTSTTASTSTTTGSGTFGGGVGVAGDINAGGTIAATSLTASTGAFSGGISVGGGPLQSLTTNGVQCANPDGQRKFVMYSNTNANYSYMGLGQSFAQFDFMVPATGNNFAFFGATSGTSRNQLLLIKGDSTGMSAAGTVSANAFVATTSVSANTLSSTTSTTTSTFHATSTTASTSTTTGAAIVDGGMGIAGNLNVGGTLNVGTLNAQVLNTINTTVTDAVHTALVTSTDTITGNVANLNNLYAVNATVSNTFTATGTTSVQALSATSIASTTTVNGATGTFTGPMTADSIVTNSITAKTKDLILNPVSGGNVYISDPTDTTKQIYFDVSAKSTNTTSVLQFPVSESVASPTNNKVTYTFALPASSAGTVMVLNPFFAQTFTGSLTMTHANPIKISSASTISSTSGNLQLAAGSGSVFVTSGSMLVNSVTANTSDLILSSSTTTAGKIQFNIGNGGTANAGFRFNGNGGGHSTIIVATSSSSSETVLGTTGSDGFNFLDEKFADTIIKNQNFNTTTSKGSVRIGVIGANGVKTTSTVTVTSTQTLINPTTASTSTTTGALVVSGGFGLAGDANIGGALTVASTTDATSYTTPAGALQVSGGIYTAKSIAAASNIRTGGVLTVQGVIQYGSTGVTQLNSGLNLNLKTTGVGNITINPATGNSNQVSMFGSLFVLTEQSTTLTVPLTVSNTAASTSTTTGAIITAGGLGVAGAANIGGTVTVTDTTDATSSTTASIKTAGGIASQKGVYAGTTVTAANSFLIPSGVNITGNTIAATGQMTITSALGSSILLSPAGAIGSVIIAEGVELQIGLTGPQIFSSGVYLDAADLNLATTSSGNVLVNSAGNVAITSTAGSTSITSSTSTSITPGTTFSVKAATGASITSSSGTASVTAPTILLNSTTGSTSVVAATSASITAATSISITPGTTFSVNAATGASITSSSGTASVTAPTILLNSTTGSTSVVAATSASITAATSISITPGSSSYTTFGGGGVKYSNPTSGYVPYQQNYLEVSQLGCNNIFDTNGNIQGYGWTWGGPSVGGTCAATPTVRRSDVQVTLHLPLLPLNGGGNPGGVIQLFTLPTRFCPSSQIEEVVRYIPNGGLCNGCAGKGSDTGAVQGLVVINTNGTVWWYKDIAKTLWPGTASTNPVLPSKTYTWLIGV